MPQILMAAGLVPFFKIYLFIHERQTRERQRYRQREKQAPCGESDVGLNPRTLGSHPELKADARPLSHPRAPEVEHSNSKEMVEGSQEHKRDYLRPCLTPCPVPNLRVLFSPGWDIILRSLR